jgi:hypothetical protein
MRGIWFFAFGAAACIEYNPPIDLPVWPDSDAKPLPPVIQEDVIVQTSTPVMDVLFTIDNSCSMEDEQDALAAYFPQFMRYFDGSGLDYHVGVVSTDLDNSQHQGKLQGSDLAGDGMATPPEYLYIDIDTPDPVSVFEDMATMGTDGTGNEKGLGAVYLALEEHRETFNAGFYREDASIHTVMISDEQDQTDSTIITKNEFIDWYIGLKQETDERTFSSIVHTEGTDRARDYIDVSETVGGIVWDITSGDWAEVLDRLGVQASGLKREYFLSQLPVPGTVVVEVHDPEGNVLPFAEAVDDPPTEGWFYTPSRNSVTFVEYMPEPLSKVVIRYTLLSSLEQQDTVSTPVE